MKICGVTFSFPRSAWHGLAVIVLAAGLGDSVQAIVSDRHLTGVHPFDCDGEWDDGKPGLDSERFRLVVMAKQSRMRMKRSNAQESAFPYQIVDGAIQFRVALPPADEADCRLDLPAGSLSCRRHDSARPGTF